MTAYEMVSRKIEGYIAEDEHYRLIVRNDDFNESPREWEPLGKMVCWHRNYNLGDEHNYSNPEDFALHLALELDDKFEDEGGTDEDIAKAWAIIKKNCVILPLYLYDHSGITMSVSPFSCPWDSGQVGYIYCTKEAAKKNWGIKNGGRVWDHVVYPRNKKNKENSLTGMTLRECTEKNLKGEVKTYDHFITGNVFSFELQTKDAEGEWEDKDSCGGFYGDDHVESGLIDYLPEEAKHLVKELEWNS